MDQRAGGSGGRLPALLRQLERRIGAERPGRSLWVWSIPAATFLVTFVLCLVVAIVGQLGWWIGVPLALLGALYMGTTAAVNLTSGMPEAHDPEDGGGGPPDDGPPRGGDGGGAPDTGSAAATEPPATTTPRVRELASTRRS